MARSMDERVAVSNEEEDREEEKGEEDGDDEECDRAACIEPNPLLCSVFLSSPPLLSSAFDTATTSSRYRSANRRFNRSKSTSAIRHVPPAIVIASGWAPPIPPHPAVTHSRPERSPPNRWRPHSANVSYVPCKMPCVPM
jgi:hypothetical protein